MINTVALKCPNCSAGLQISLKMSSFACGYCGASQIVERSGGVITLKLLTEAISRVEAGTDKAAAELALIRLKDELRDIETSYEKLEMNMLDQRENLLKIVKLIWVGASLFCGLFFYWNAVYFLAGWVVLSLGIVYFYLRERSKNNGIYTAGQKQLFKQGNEIKRQILQQQKIVDANAK